jgi:hypothetical protein
VDGSTRLLRASRWAAVGGLVFYVLLATRDRFVPLGPAVPFWQAWLPLAALGLAGGGLIVRLGRPARPWLGPVESMAVLAATAMVLTDLNMTYQPLRDLEIYLKAGRHFVEGSPVYLQAPMTVRPTDLSNYPFLYPPLTLPFFAVLAALPQPLVQAGWVAASAALGLAALAEMGVGRRWLVPALLWPPLFQGLWVGNVSVPALALFALGLRYGSGLVLGGVFKSYTGLAALWLVRERRWASLGRGVAAVAVLAALTLPLTGFSAWQAWLEALRLYQISQPGLTALYGFGLPRFVPLWLYLVLAVAAVGLALSRPGREGLARFGTATIVASPSLWGHGLLVAVPSLLSLRSFWLWLAVGFTAAPDGSGWWLTIATIAASWGVASMRRDRAGAEDREAAHPLGGRVEPWPAADGSLRPRVAPRFRSGSA